MPPVPKPLNISTQIAKTIETELEEEKNKVTKAARTGIDTGRRGTIQELEPKKA